MQHPIADSSRSVLLVGCCRISIRGSLTWNRKYHTCLIFTIGDRGDSDSTCLECLGKQSLACPRPAYWASTALIVLRGQIALRIVRPASFGHSKSLLSLNSFPTRFNKISHFLVSRNLRSAALHRPAELPVCPSDCLSACLLTVQSACIDRSLSGSSGLPHQLKFNQQRVQ